MKACCLIRPQPHYRHDAFIAGLKAAGYDVSANAPSEIERGDALAIWNRYWMAHDMAIRYEAAGGVVFVAENGYIGKDADGIQHYAIAVGGHNGSGHWRTGAEDRLAALNLDLKPWQNNPDGHILVCAQRGIGSPSMASPPDWHTRAADRLRQLTKRTIRIRYHPEDRNAPKSPRTLDEDLAGAWACVVWSSTSGVKALVQGIPVLYDAPHWICEKAAPRGFEQIEAPWRSDANRYAALLDMAWAQWTVAEIAAGTPFRWLTQD